MEAAIHKVDLNESEHELFELLVRMRDQRVITQAELLRRMKAIWGPVDGFDPAAAYPKLGKKGMLP